MRGASHGSGRHPRTFGTQMRTHGSTVAARRRYARPAHSRVVVVRAAVAAPASVDELQKKFGELLETKQPTPQALGSHAPHLLTKPPDAAVI